MTQVIQARREDLTTLAPFVNKAYRGESSRKGWTTEADLLGGQRIDEKMLGEMIEAPRSTILMLVTEPGVRLPQSLRVCVHVKMIEPQTAYLGLLTVDPESQTQGLGRTMLSRAEDFCRKEWGAQEIVITVIDIRTELIAW